MAVTKPVVPAVALGAGLTERQARAIYQQGPEAVVFALLAQAKMIGEAQAAAADAVTATAAAADSPPPSTPSAMVPVYTKPAVKPKRGKRPGRPAGHPGSRRGRPDRVDQTKSHRAKRCPCCGGSLKRCRQTRTRYTEDIPQDVQPVVTGHVIHRDWCPRCRKHVEPTGRTTLNYCASIASRVLVVIFALLGDRWSPRESVAASCIASRPP